MNKKIVAIEEILEKIKSNQEYLSKLEERLEKINENKKGYAEGKITIVGEFSWQPAMDFDLKEMSLLGKIIVSETTNYLNKKIALTRQKIAGLLEQIKNKI